MNQTFKGKFAVITGGGSGIGLAIAKDLSDEGADVIITGRNAQTLQEAVKALGKNVKGIVADVSSKVSIDALYEQVKTEFGHIDIIVANAAGGVLDPLCEITE